MIDPEASSAASEGASRRVLWAVLAVVAILMAAALLYFFWPASSGDGVPSEDSGKNSLGTVATPPNGKGVEIEESGFATVSSQDAISFGMVVKNKANVGAQGVEARLAPKTATGEPLTDQPIVVTVNFVLPGKEMAVGAMIDGSRLTGELDDVAEVSVALGAPEKWWSDDGTLSDLARVSVVGEPEVEPRSHERTYISFVTGGDRRRGGVPYVLVALFRDSQDKIVGSCFQEWEIVGAKMNAAFDDCYLPKKADVSTMRIYGDLVVSELHHIPDN